MPNRSILFLINRILIHYSVYYTNNSSEFCILLLFLCLILLINSCINSLMATNGLISNISCIFCKDDGMISTNHSIFDCSETMSEHW